MITDPNRAWSVPTRRENAIAVAVAIVAFAASWWLMDRFLDFCWLRKILTGVAAAIGAMVVYGMTQELLLDRRLAREAAKSNERKEDKDEGGHAGQGAQ